MPLARQPAPWKVSLHGGHSGLYCDHASGTLDEILEAAVAAGYQTFGVSEHAPRFGDQFLYEEEIAMGWDVERLRENFERYARDVREIASAFEDRVSVLIGFEAEVVPTDGYAEIMLELRERHAFEYIVGSVHHVGETMIDGPTQDFERAIHAQDGLENLGVAYYGAVAAMVQALKPEVVGHLDLIRKNAPSNESVDTPRLREAARETLEVIRDSGAILDLNTAGYRKGLGTPYPAPRLLRTAHDMGVPLCFGDDSHAPDQVGAGIDEAREYLLENGVTTITALAREGGSVIKKKIPLEA